MGRTLPPASRRTHTGRLSAAIVAIAVLVPGTANAQREPFIDHLITFRTLLFGPYGDEGERIVETLEQLAGALAVWNDADRVQEKKLRSENRPDAAAVLLADAGRFPDALLAIDAALTEAPERRHLQTLRGRLLEAMGREAEAAGCPSSMGARPKRCSERLLGVFDADYARRRRVRPARRVDSGGAATRIAGCRTGRSRTDP